MHLSAETSKIQVESGQFEGTERFEIIQLLGQGGMGTVFEAYDRELETSVALKVLQRVTPQSLLNFKQEFRSLADIRHPNLVSLGELHEHDGVLFFTMELIRGRRFAEHVRSWTSTSERGSTIRPASATKKVDTHILDPRTVIDFSVLPEDTVFEEKKLRFALRQLVLAVMAIHDAGKVHRDIKPSNIMVTSQGRVVLLDFGLVSDRDADVDDDTIVGTVPYMAPEQTQGKRVGPAADWYALGAVIYQVLTGRPPFVGPVGEIMRAKIALPPPRPRRLVPTVPADLDALCMELLEIEPHERPGARDILARLSSDGESSVEPTETPEPRSWAVGESPFVGRRAELLALENAARRSASGESTVVFVQGESGVGKSALIQRFCEALTSEKALLLKGRCYERESVAYKAFDEIVDAACRHLCSLDPQDRSDILSPWIGFSAQLFPVLRRIPEVGGLEVGGDMPAQERRSRAFAGIRDMMNALCERYSVVLSIDDLQWTDHDSMALLAELLRPPQQPPVLLLATIRTSIEGMQARSPEELKEGIPCPVEEIEVGALPHDDARELVGLLSGGKQEIDAQDLIAETGGHPLFIDAMLRYRESNRDGEETLRLDDALRWRARTMEAGSRELLEMLCVAGMPLRRRTVAWATIRDPGVLDRWMAALAETNLIRTMGSGADAMVEPFHDRVREAVSDGLSDEQRARWHLRLATALEADGDGTDGEIMAFHRFEAGEVGRAIEHMMRAARAATDGLAFDRAVRLYEWCWKNELDDSPRHDELATLLGYALARAGRGSEAARVFLDVAPRVGAVPRVELERLAAEQLLRSGHVEEGVEVLRRVVGSVGMNVPKTPVAALVEILAHRLYTKVRGLGFHERAEEDIDPAVLRRIDIAWSASASLTMTDTIRGVLFQERHFRMCLKAGEPYRLARAFAVQSWYASNVGAHNRPQTEKLVAHARELAKLSGRQHVIALCLCSEGGCDYLMGEWKNAAQRCREGVRELKVCREGTTYEIDSLTVFGLSAMALAGEFQELAVQVPKEIREADERRDRFASTNLRLGHINTLWLVADEVETASQRCDEASVYLSKSAFHVQHYYEMLARMHIDLYQGDTEAAVTRVETNWDALWGSMLTRVQHPRMFGYYLRIRASAARAWDVEGAERRRLLGVVDKFAKKLGAESARWGGPASKSVMASAEALRGNEAQARALLEQAANEFLEVDMPVHSAAVRRRLGELLGGTEGAEHLEQSDQTMREHAVVEPEKLTSIYAPRCR